MEAVFPLALIQGALKLKGKLDHALADRFGYIEAKRMAPAVFCQPGGLTHVHCGAYPLVAHCWYAADGGWGNITRGCYINTIGEHVYPG